MSSSQLELPLSPDDRRDSRVDGWYATELEKTVQFGLRRRELQGILPSGSVSMDAALGVGGLPRGRVVELFGPPAVGKTTLGLQAVAAVQREGETAAFVDVERSFDPPYAARMGVDLDSLLLARADDGWQAFQILEKLAGCKAVDLIVVDSAAALVPPEEREVALGGGSPFAQCELLASGLRRLARALQGSPACVVFLNQVRNYQGFGYRETSAGGWAMKLHASVRADLRERAELRHGKRVQLRVIKNQLATPRQTEFDLQAGVGVVREAELLDRGLEAGVISLIAGAYVYDGQVVGRNRFEVLSRLEQHSTLAAQIHTDVRVALGLVQRRPAGREGGSKGGLQTGNVSAG